MKRKFTGRILALAFVILLLVNTPIEAGAVAFKNSKGGYTVYYGDDNDVVYVDGEDPKIGFCYFKQPTKGCTIAFNSKCESVDIWTPLDVAKLGNFKSSSKNLKIKVFCSIKDNYNADIWYINRKDRTRYYYNHNGDKVECTAESDNVIEQTNKYHGYEYYKIQLFTKKAGTYKFSYNMLDHNGKLIAKKTVKVVAQEDRDPIKTCKYNGKTVYNSTLRYGKGKRLDSYNKHDDIDTTKTSGKLKVYMNKGFKLKKIEVEHLKYKTERNGDSWRIYSDYSEWVPVKNGGKITLNTTNVMSDNYYSEYNNSGRPVPVREYSQREAADNIVTTAIRVTYWDTRAKALDEAYFYISLLSK